jgi:hypothetical protein
LTHGKAQCLVHEPRAVRSNGSSSRSRSSTTPVCSDASHHGLDPQARRAIWDLVNGIRAVARRSFSPRT